MNKLVTFGTLCLFALISAGCGGGGGGTGNTAPTAAGSVQGYVDTGAAARTAGRSAAISPLAGASITTSTGASATADGSGFFSITGIPAGNYISLTATKNNLSLRMYVNVTAGATITKNINARTTASSMIYEKLKDQNLTSSAPADPATIDTSPLTTDVKTEIEDAITAGTYNYGTAAAGASVTASVARISSGGSLSDRTPPALAFSSPGASSLVSDVDFRSETFNFLFGYSDSAPLHAASLKITLSMDSGAETDITEYFTQPDAASIQSGGIYQFTRTLFNLASNDKTRTMTINMTAEDASGNSQSVSWTFTVYPQAPPTQ